MKKGGYQIVDFGGASVSLNVGVTIDGIYNTINGSNKVCLFSGITNFRDMFVNLEKDDDGNFVGYSAGNKVLIDADDEVTISNENPYFLIEDFGNEEFTVDTPKTVTGIYDRIEGTEKAVLIKGLTVGDSDFRTFVANVTISSTNFVIEIGDYVMTITDEDSVTITEKE